ncbi:MAG TPA: GNAT family N-acetyltransferase [Anaerolineales bacterium]|nr:GNAT family N-acetyltransferase [Anaerolineales bacterium]
MVEAVGFVIRMGGMADLPALEWDGEYLRYRAVYRSALEAAERGERALLVAEVDGEVVGQIFIHFVSPWPIPGSFAPTGYLYAFRVRPEQRGRGIGQALLREAENLLEAAGAGHAVIAVARDNPEARKLYDRRGYSWLADDPGHWTYVDAHGATRHVHEPAHLLVKTLTPSPSPARRERGAE